MSTSPVLLTIRETAAELRVSVATVERMLRRRDLGRVKVGHATRILRRDIDAYIESHREGAA
jgi:excisionase family DNA binding protein